MELATLCGGETSAFATAWLFGGMVFASIVTCFGAGTFGLWRLVAGFSGGGGSFGVGPISGGGFTISVE